MNAPHTPSDTRSALQLLPVKDCNRSLYFDRYARPELEKEARRDYFKDGRACMTFPAKRDAWRDFLLTGLGLKPDDLMFAQLQARLMVNMAGGVMENAGLCLDRLTGIPYIPGSAVKGCARRMAIQQLLEESDQTKKAALLVKIARVFGWSELEWILPKPQWDDQQWKERRSDFAFACDTAWPAVRDAVRKQLIAELQAETFPDHYAGDIQFMPAYPVDLGQTGKVDGLPLEVPELGKLELDVVTCHHREYYAGNPQYATAPDTEEPVPVVFPAVAPGHVFIFAVLPGRRCGDELLQAAKQWLATGLSVFGLGAKTAAGYGWFDASDEFNLTTRAVLAKAQQAEQERQARERAEAEQQARAEAERQKREADKKALASMTPEQQHDYKIAQLSDQQLDSKLQQFTKLPEAEAAAVVRALRGPRAAAWAKLKERGQKGQWAQVVQAVYALNKKLNLGKMP
jgi:CRISPR-associated protein Cmr6